MNIAVVYSKPSKRILATPYGETDTDSQVIAHMVELGLKARDLNVSVYPIQEDNIKSILDIKADCIFNLIEWCGLDIDLAKQAFEYFRELNIPVTGADERMYVLTGDKVRVKQELTKIEVPTPKSQIFVTGSEEIVTVFHYPVIVKPSLEHCSTGLSYDSVAYTESELLPIIKRQIGTFEQPVLAEEFIDGRELLVYMIEKDGEPTMLPICEILFDSKRSFPFQTYESKWVKDHEDYNSTYTEDAVLSDIEFKTINEICVKIFKEMDFRGYARFDLRLRDGVPYILETNANPSVFDATEELKDINEEVITGIQFPDYLLAIVKSAFNNPIRA